MPPKRRAIVPAPAPALVPAPAPAPIVVVAAGGRRRNNAGAGVAQPAAAAVVVPAPVAALALVPPVVVAVAGGGRGGRGGGRGRGGAAPAPLLGAVAAGGRGGGRGQGGRGAGRGGALPIVAAGRGRGFGAAGAGAGGGRGAGARGGRGGAAQANAAAPGRGRGRGRGAAVQAIRGARAQDTSDDEDATAISARTYANSVAVLPDPNKERVLRDFVVAAQRDANRGRNGFLTQPRSREIITYWNGIHRRVLAFANGRATPDVVLQAAIIVLREFDEAANQLRRVNAIVRPDISAADLDAIRRTKHDGFSPLLVVLVTESDPIHVRPRSNDEREKAKKETIALTAIRAALRTDATIRTGAALCLRYAELQRPYNVFHGYFVAQMEDLETRVDDAMQLIQEFQSYSFLFDLASQRKWCLAEMATVARCCRDLLKQASPKDGNSGTESLTLKTQEQQTWLVSVLKVAFGSLRQGLKLEDIPVRICGLIRDAYGVRVMRFQGLGDSMESALKITKTQANDLALMMVGHLVIHEFDNPHTEKESFEKFFDPHKFTDSEHLELMRISAPHLLNLLFCVLTSSVVIANTGASSPVHGVEFPLMYNKWYRSIRYTFGGVYVNMDAMKHLDALNKTMSESLGQDGAIGVTAVKRRGRLPDAQIDEAVSQLGELNYGEIAAAGSQSRGMAQKISDAISGRAAVRAKVDEKVPKSVTTGTAHGKGCSKGHTGFCYYLDPVKYADKIARLEAPQVGKAPKPAASHQTSARGGSAHSNSRSQSHRNNNSVKSE